MATEDIYVFIKKSDMELERKYNFINQKIKKSKKEMPIFLFTSIFIISIFFFLFIFGLLIFLYYLQPNNFLALLVIKNLNISGNHALTTGGIYNREGSDIFTAITFFLAIGTIGLRVSLKSFFNSLYCLLLLKIKKYKFNFNIDEAKLVIDFLRNLPISRKKLEEKKSDPAMEKIIIILFLINFIGNKNGQIKQINGFEILNDW